jgi:hypothetical protein
MPRLQPNQTIATPAIPANTRRLSIAYAGADEPDPFPCQLLLDVDFMVGEPMEVVGTFQHALQLILVPPGGSPPFQQPSAGVTNLSAFAIDLTFL